NITAITSPKIDSYLWHQQNSSRIKSFKIKIHQTSRSSQVKSSIDIKHHKSPPGHCSTIAFFNTHLSSAPTSFKILIQGLSRDLCFQSPYACSLSLSRSYPRCLFISVSV